MLPASHYRFTTDTLHDIAVVFLRKYKQLGMTIAP